MESSQDPAPRKRGRPGRLSPDQVDLVRNAHREGLSDAQAGALVGISKSHARRIRRGERLNNESEA